MNAAVSRSLRTIHGAWALMQEAGVFAHVGRRPPLPAAASRITQQEAESLHRIRDDLVVTLTFLRQIANTLPSAVPEQVPEVGGADPYPSICADLRTALAHLNTFEQTNGVRAAHRTASIHPPQW